ncbi:hypothetical protein TrVE_jg6426 [Triparma verrucosa]|uniref:Vacuolar protein 8 n=1 Tax=Triparma verrucosa TaxID=1606542 RepID=A0A9W7CPR7_9STRA|nr:hypothetical protein TrVE_jg6426 [Triparma verrucosa]
MSYDELQVEIERLREELESANLEKERLHDEREEMVNQYEEEFDKRKQELLDENQVALSDLKASQDGQIQTLSHQLDQMYRAFQGDACGWSEKTDRRTNKTQFVNAETGETSKEKPQILEFAEKVMSLDQKDGDKNALHKATNKAREAETAKRKMEVTVNETRAEIMNQKSLLKNWTNASVEIFHEMNAFDVGMEQVHNAVMQKLPHMTHHVNVVTVSKERAEKATERVRDKNECINAQHFKITALERKVASLTTENEKLKDKVEKLEEQMDTEIEVMVAPLRLQVAQANANLMKEKAARTQDRIELADLWPPGWLMPSVLMKFKTMDVREKAEKRKKALELDAERALKEEIRRAVTEAGKWSEQYDEYGQMFYQHMDTGASEWTQPEAMLYVPPPGRDEMGNKLMDAAPPGLSSEEVDDAAAELANWKQETDQWGQVFYTNDATGETSWEAPEGFVADEAALGAIDPKVAASESARVVISYMKNRKPEVDEDGEEEELVYDMQTLEEIAAGNDGWKYKKPGDSLADADEDGMSLAESLTHASAKATENPPEPLTMDELRELVYSQAISESDLETNLRKTRSRLAKLSHRLLEKKKIEDLEEEMEHARLKKLEEEQAKLAAQQDIEGITDSEFEISDDETDKPKAKPKSDLDFIKDEVKEVARQRAEKEAKEEAKGMEDAEKTPSKSPAPAAESKDDGESPGSPETSKPEGKDGDAVPIPVVEDKVADPNNSPENEIPAPSPEAKPDSDSSPAKQRQQEEQKKKSTSVQDKIMQLKGEHEDPGELTDEDADDATAMTTSASPELQEILANRATPFGKINNQAVQALAIQAVWAGFNDSEVKVPPKELISGSSSGELDNEWAMACFFATLDDDLSKTPQFNIESKGDTGETPLPETMNKRELRHQYNVQVQEKRKSFLSHAASIADIEAHNDLQRVTDDMFSLSVTKDRAGLASGDQVDMNESVITKRFSQDPKGISFGTTRSADQMPDPEPGAKFPDRETDKVRIGEQKVDRQAKILGIKKRDKMELETPWLLEGKDAPEKKNKSTPTKQQQQDDEESKAEAENETDVAAEDDDSLQEEKKSSSPRRDNDDEASLKSMKSMKSTNTKQSLAPSVGSGSLGGQSSFSSYVMVDGDDASIAAQQQPPQMTIEQVDSVFLMRENAVIHDSALRPLLAEADKLRGAVWSDHYDIAQFWRDQIDKTEEQKEKLSKAIREQQATIANMAGNLKGLGIQSSKPKAPEPPKKPKHVNQPRDVSVGDEEIEEDKPVMMLDADFKKLVTDIGRNVYDGKTVLIPAGVKVTESQKGTILKSIKSKNEAMDIKYKTEEEAYGEKMAKFTASLEDYEERDSERAGEFQKVKYNMRILSLKADHMHVLREGLDTEIERFKVELQMEEKRGLQLTTMQGRSETVRAKQVMEHYRGPEAIANLQDQLCLALEQRNRAMKLPESAVAVLQRVKLEEARTNALRQLRMTIGRIREQLITEGRRRRDLYEEEFAAAQKEVRMIRDENNQSIERSNSLRVIETLVRLDVDTKELLKDSMVEEATEDREGTDTAGLFGEVYAEDKKWSTHAVHAAQHELVDVQRCLGAALEARALARVRESNSREQGTPGNATSLPPHADQWLPTSERVRMEEEIEWVKYHADLVVANSGAELKNEQMVVDALKGHIEVLKNKLSASEMTRQRDVETIRFTADEAFELLQKSMRDFQRVTKEKESRYEEAIAALSKEINETRKTMQEELDVLKTERETMVSMATVLRYELSEFHVREDVTRKELEKVKDLWRRDVDTLKVQLRSERNHTARLELWIASMHDDVKYYLKEIKLREDRLLSKQKESEAAKLALKYERWKQTTAIYALGTDVDALFLFFLQRVVNLAGSGKKYNDALRENGAMSILAAVAQSPRKDLRRLAARALGSMGWNGFVEQRLLGWDVIRSWTLHIDNVIPAKEEELKKLGKTFEDKVATEEGEEGEEGANYAPSPNMSLRGIIRERRQWALRRARRREGPNEENQLMLGSERSVLKLLLDLCRVKEWDVVRYACMALAVAAYHESNNGIMGKTKHCVETVVKLCRNVDEEIQTQAAATLANLGYANQRNQELIGASGGVESLVDLCRGVDVDVIESASAALANIVTLHTGNAVRLAECGGIDVLTHLITSNQIVNLLDFDQVSEIQANCAECLANCTRNYGKANAARIHDLGVAPLVLMCGSHNLQVQRHSALVLGNISQDEDQREVIGVRGGVEALMRLCEISDEAVQANSLWALSNLAWHPLNQERIGRYLGEILELCKSDFLPVMVNALCCLANSLYFHDKNRERLGEIEGGVKLVVDMCGEEYGEEVWENALRAVVSLTYVDEVGAKLGKEGLIRVLVKRCESKVGIIQKFAGMALLNLSIHDALKIRILQEGGVEALAGMQDSENKEARQVALDVLEALADIRSVDELADQKAAFGVKGMLDLVQTDNDLIVKLACESLAEEVWSGGEAKQNEVIELGGAQILMKVMCKKDVKDDILNPSLWSLRNLVHGHVENKGVFGGLGGVEGLIKIISETYRMRKMALVESGLTALVNLVVDHEKNCRMLLKEGLDVLIGIAEGYEQEQQDAGDSSLINAERKEGMKNNAALATSLLQLVGPYNYLVCSNCGKQQLSGTSCEACGRSISFAVDGS